MEKTYSNSETDNEQASRSNHGATGAGAGDSVGVIGVVVGVQREGTQGGEDDEPREHPETTNNHGDTATKLLADIQTAESGGDVDGTQDHGSNVGVGDTDGIEDLGSVVEEEVGASQLLQGLQSHADEDTTEHSRGSEDLVPLLLATGLLSLEVLTDVTEGILHFGVLLRNLRDESESLGGLDGTTTAELPTGRLAHDKHTHSHDGGRNEADTHGDAPGSRRLDALRAVVHAVGDKDTESNEQLVGRNEGTANLARSGLGLVHGRQDRKSTNAEAVNETANDDLVPCVLRGDADNVADNVDNVPEGDAVLAAKLVGNRAGDKGADQATNAEHTDHQTLADVAKLW